MYIVVVGCGLAGLVTGIALVKAGHEVDILESVPKITYIGAGIQISPNSSRILRALGVAPYILPHCTEPISLRMMRWQNGRTLVDVPLKQPSLDDYHSPYWHIHRADFHRGLLACATDLGIKTHLSCRVVSVDPTIPSLITAEGEVFHADLIVASDGLHSTLRDVVVGFPSPPVPTGQQVYRVTLPAARLQGLGPSFDDLITVPRNNHWIGPHGTALSYLLEGLDQKFLNLVLTTDTRLPDGVNRKAGSNDEARRAFQGWDPRIDKALEHAESILEWRLYTHKEIPSWVHPDSKVILIGDAAHAMTPYLAQGAAMGIEDAAILGGLLEKHPSKEVLAETLKMYEKLRIKRTARVAEASIGGRWFTQMEDGEEQRRRDEWLLKHPGIQKGHINMRSDKDFLDFLFGYDAYQALGEAIRQKDEEKNSFSGMLK